LAEGDTGSEPDASPAGSPGEARADRGRRRRRGRRRDRDRSGYAAAPASAGEDLAPGFEDLSSGTDSAWQFDRDRASADDAFDEFDEVEAPHGRRPGRSPLDEEDLGGDEQATERTALDDQIDAELEQEIQREVDEIAELEREMGLRGPAEARTRRGDQPPRGGRSMRGRGLVKPPIQEIFRRGDEVLVQVIKESIGTKGPTLSTYISIPGRYLVLMPGLNRVGVSRKIIDEGQRRKLRDIMNELNPPKGLGFIVRTAGLERTKRELARDLAYLLRLWKVILRRIKKSKAPTPIYQESDMIIRTIRDIFNSEIDTIWIDEPSAFERAQDFLKVVMPRFVNRLKLYDEKVPLFHKYGIEDEIAKIQRRHVPLPEGGSIVIDQTEALVAIDVNSGNFRVEDDAERTAYEMNLRAAKEIARQLRLRDLGGVIVNDFIDMREERHRRGVERALRDAIKRDRARTKVLRMSAFGLIEMTRQRIRPSLKRSIYEDCPHCGGAGVAKTAESMAIDVMRLLALASHREEIRRISVSVHPSVATYLGNRKRQQLAKLESESNISILVAFDENAAAEHLKIECYDANGNEIRPFPSVGPSHKRGH
jgi:ribonuclease E